MGDRVTAVLFGEEGADLDAAELVNEVLPDLQTCLDTHGETPATESGS